MSMGYGGYGGQSMEPPPGAYGQASYGASMGMMGGGYQGGMMG
jgi:hypothetical protein